MLCHTLPCLLLTVSPDTMNLPHSDVTSVDLKQAVQALDPSASIEVVGAPGEGSLPGQGYSEKGNEAEKCNLVVDSTLRVLDAPSMQPDKVTLQWDGVKPCHVS